MRVAAPLVMLIMLAPLGCKPPADMPSDAGMPIDATMIDLAGCHPTFGRSFYITQYTILPAGMGFDLNNDGKEDNVLGSLGQFANPAWADSVKKGSSIFLWDFSGLAGPPLVEGDMPTLAFYIGVDGDNPADPTNNGSGSGQFIIPAEQFDVSCRSTAKFDDTTVQNGMLVAHKKRLILVAPAVGSLEFSQVVLNGQLSADYGVFSGRLGGSGTACALSLTPSPAGSGSVLDLVVNNFNLQPDIDGDGDGLEKITGDGSVVTGCVDGDGTMIAGHDCTCNPKIADAFSAAFDFTTVPAKIVGLTTSQ